MGAFGIVKSDIISMFQSGDQQEEEVKEQQRQDADLYTPRIGALGWSSFTAVACRYLRMDKRMSNGLSMEGPASGMTSLYGRIQNLFCHWHPVTIECGMNALQVK